MMHLWMRTNQPTPDPNNDKSQAMCDMLCELGGFTPCFLGGARGANPPPTMPKRSVPVSMLGLYDVMLPPAKWPRCVESWSHHDWESATMLNALLLDHDDPLIGVGGGWSKPFINRKKCFIKVSQVIQALDLADFDDCEFVLNRDLRSPPGPASAVGHFFGSDLAAGHAHGGSHATRWGYPQFSEDSFWPRCL